MASAASLRDAVTGLAETLIIGAASGAVLGLAHFPAGWLSGAITRSPRRAAAPADADPQWRSYGWGWGEHIGPAPRAADGDAGAFHVPKPRCLLLMVTAIGARSRLMRGWVRTSAIGAPTATNRTDRAGS